MKRLNVFERAYNWLRGRDAVAALEGDVKYWKRLFSDSAENGMRLLARIRSLEDDVRYWKKSLIETCEYYSTERTKDLGRVHSLEERIAQLDRLYGDVSAANQYLAQRIHKQARKIQRYSKRLREFHEERGMVSCKT